MINSSQNSIPVFGYYGHNNAGDEAFKSVFSNFFGTRPDQFHSHVKEKSFDRLILGGGAVINDYFISEINDVERLDIVGCSLPYGAGDVKHLERLRPIISDIFVRSRADAEAFQEHGFNAKFVPDIVFSMEPKGEFSFDDLVACAALPPIGFDPDRKNLFVFLSDDYSSMSPDSDVGRRNSKFADELALTLDKMAGRFNIIMPSMSVWYNARDYLFAGTVMRKMKHRERVCLIEQYVEPQKLLDAIADRDSAVMSMKFHGLVFGLVAKRFICNIGSTRKNRDLMSDLKLTGLSAPIGKGDSDAFTSILQRHRQPDLLARISDSVDQWQDEVRTELTRIAASH